MRNSLREWSLVPPECIDNNMNAFDMMRTSQCFTDMLLVIVTS